MEEGALGQPDRPSGVRIVDLETPRDIGRQAEELLIEPVAEAADGLCQQQTGRQRVGERVDILDGAMQRLGVLLENVVDPLEGAAEVEAAAGGPVAIIVIGDPGSSPPASSLKGG